MTERTVTVTLTEEQAKLIVFLMDSERYDCAEPIREAVAALPPVMEEPAYLGAVVMTDDGPAVRATESPNFPWRVETGDWFDWDNLPYPRPLTDAERRENGIPGPLPAGHVAMTRVARRYPPRYWREIAADARKRGANDLIRLLCEVYADALEAAEAEGPDALEVAEAHDMDKDYYSPEGFGL